MDCSDVRGRDAHIDHLNKVGQAYRQTVVATYPACNRWTQKEITVNVLGQWTCEECGKVIPRFDHRGLAACECTIWNAGKPRPDKIEEIKYKGYSKFIGQYCRASV